MKWEFFKYAEIGGTRAVVSRMCECPRCGGVHTSLGCESESLHVPTAGVRRIVVRKSSVGEGVAFQWEANGFPYKRGGAA